MPLKKAIAKKLCKFGVFCFFHIFLGFLLLTFFGAFLKAHTNKFEISLKFCIIFIPILIFFKKKKKFGLQYNSTFCKLQMQMLKKLYIFKHFEKSTFHSLLNPNEIPKSIKLKPPGAQSQIKLCYTQTCKHLQSLHF
jgi:hypothetical protein